MERHQSAPRELFDTHAKVAIGAIGVVWLATVLGGGSARPDVVQLVPLRLLAVIGVIAILLLVPRERFLQRAPLLFTAVVAVFLLIQLVPLPPSIWRALPGREPYATLSDIAGIGEIWRPLTLSPDLTLNSLLSLAPPLFFLLAIPVLGRRGRSWILKGLLITILASGFLGLLQIAGGAESSLRYYRVVNNMSGIGFFANRNHEAVFLAMGIPLATWWATHGDDHRRRGRLFLAGAAILFLLVSVLTTQSRTGAFVVLLAIVLSAVSLLRWGGFGKIARLWVMGGVLLALPLAAVALGTWGASRQSLAAASEDLRIRILPESIEAIRTFFPFGAGFGSFAHVFPRFESVDDLGPTYANHTHNELTQIVIEGGIVSILLLAVFLIWFGRALVRSWRGNGGKAQSMEAQLCTTLMLLPLVASVTDYPLRTPLLACTFAAVAALLYSGSGRPSRKQASGV